MNHDSEVRHVPNALFPRTYTSRRHWAPGWRLICSCGARGVMRATEEEAKIDKAFHGEAIEIVEAP